MSEREQDENKERSNGENIGNNNMNNTDSSRSRLNTIRHGNGDMSGID